jgi:hypothetical protein
MKVLVLVLQLLTYLSQLLERTRQTQKQEELDDQYKDIRRNPRDLFDDGVLNNSSAQGTTSAEPSPSVPRTNTDGPSK